MEKERDVAQEQATYEQESPNAERQGELKENEHQEKNAPEEQEKVREENGRQDAQKDELGDPEKAKEEQNEELAAANAKIAELEAKIKEMENRYLRLYADFENFRRRTRQEMEAAEKYRAQSLVSDLLPVLDNFERALKIKAEDEQAKSILQGMEMVYRSVLDALKKEGVEAIEAVGKPFDPHLHQAVMQVEDSNYEPNTVVEELQKGYKLKDRVIRPAMVKVSQ
ncbi:nucleotide exchange factor GrpE [Parageobacillus thermoglucosidasius]|uniref:Protein GrpE n=2 Tax=Anoxybacillaceae TaxID=3120669 RepID=A0AB38QV27_PARTM|nr:nucleotide exchange factor GrpE [Parageobacillus thermoglucosidasius]UOE75442.1 nucleotide exchange factor GrpE [Parageobacillus thermoglucosidasius]GCD81786.1 protein GrpE [Parageobacillus thermoglucosidasius]